MKLTKIIAAVAALTIVGEVTTVNAKPSRRSPLISFAETDEEGNNYTLDIYQKKLTVKIYDDHIEIADCNESIVGELDIPDEMLGLPVTVIGEDAFHSCKDLTKVTIPDTVTAIGAGAFSFCDFLTEVNIPNGITRIEDSTFLNCLNLETVNIPAGVTSIGDFAFSHCESLTSIALPDSITSIGEYAFNFCSSIPSVTIPAKVETIEQYTFSGCKSLSEVTILNPNCHFSSANCISNSSWDIFFDGTIRGFEDSTAQKFAKTCGYNFEILDELPDDHNYSEGTFGDLTYKKYGDHIEITDCDDSAKSIAIPAKIEGVPVTEIGAYAFEYCQSLTVIALPDSITSIGERAFYKCTELAEITIPDSVTEIGDSAFYQCKSLDEIKIPDGVTEIGDHVFFGCGSLTDITIPDSVATIGESAFAWCENLTEITIPDSVEKICGQAFSGTKWLGNRQAEDPLVVVNRILIDGSACGENVTIPDGVASIADYAFFGTKTLTEITTPDSLTEIGFFAFGECTELTKVTLSAGVTSIDDSAFSYCGSLTEITILNPGCEINDSKYTISNGNDEYYNAFYSGVIRGYDGSTAQKYAEIHDYRFESLGKAPEQTEDKFGDANCDGEVTVADAAAILQYLGNKNKFPLSEQGLKNADVDGKAGVTTTDALAIQNYKSGLVSKLPIA